MRLGERDSRPEVVTLLACIRRRAGVAVLLAVPRDAATVALMKTAELSRARAQR